LFVLRFHDWKGTTRERVLLNLAKSEQERGQVLEQRLEASTMAATMAQEQFDMCLQEAKADAMIARKQYDEQALSQFKLLRCQFGLRKLQLLRRHLVKSTVTHAFHLWCVYAEEVRSDLFCKETQALGMRVEEGHCRLLKVAAMNEWKLLLKAAQIHRSSTYHHKTMHILGAINVRRIFKSLRRQMLSGALTHWLLDGVESGARTQAEIVHRLNAELKRAEREKQEEAEHANECANQTTALQKQLVQTTSQAHLTQQKISNEVTSLRIQVVEVQQELDDVVAQKARLEGRISNEKASESQLREECDRLRGQIQALQREHERIQRTKASDQQTRDECDILKAQLHALQSDYDRLRRSSQGTDPMILQLQTLQKLHDQDRREKQRLRDELQALRTQGGASRASLAHPWQQSNKFSEIDAKIDKYNLEISTLEKSLTDVSGHLERQLDEIREEGAAPTLLKGAKGTMDRGNTLTLRLERLNAEKLEAEAQRDRLRADQKRSMSAGRSRSRSASPTERLRPAPKQQKADKTDTFDLLDVNGDGVIDRTEFMKFMGKHSNVL